MTAARKRAAAARKLRRDEINPIAAKRAENSRKVIEAAGKAATMVTFRMAAEGYIATNRAAWRNEKHAAQWTATLEAHAYPVIGNVAVSAVNTGHITRILIPLWNTKSETASRVRGRIETVLDYAKVHGWRPDENPARWKGHLDNVLPRARQNGRSGRASRRAALGRGGRLHG